MVCFSFLFSPRLVTENTALPVALLLTRNNDLSIVLAKIRAKNHRKLERRSTELSVSVGSVYKRQTNPHVNKE